MAKRLFDKYHGTSAIGTCRVRSECNAGVRSAQSTDTVTMKTTRNAQDQLAQRVKDEMKRMERLNGRLGR